MTNETITRREDKRMTVHKYLCAFVLALFFVLGTVFEQHETLAQSTGLFNQLLEASKAEMAKKGGKLSVAMSLNKRMGKPMVKAFQKDFSFIKKVTYHRVNGVPAMMKTLLSAQQGRTPEWDMMHVSAEVWPNYRKAGLFVKPPFDYHKLAKSLPADWGEVDSRAIDPEGMFMSTAGKARGNAWNPELVPKGKEPTTWEACLDPMWRGKFLYDPRPKLTGLWYDSKTKEMHIKWLKGIVKNKVVLNRGQTENIQKVIGGEFPLVCGVNFHSSMALIELGAPLKFALPDPFVLEFGTTYHNMKWTTAQATTQLLVLWLASKGQGAVTKYGYRGRPWNPKSKKYSMSKGKYVAICDAECLLRRGEYQKLHSEILGLPGVR